VTFYVMVDDPQKYLDRAEQLGGKTVMPPSEIPGAGITLAMLTDPEGHLIGLTKSS
jgi:predicted enzyme related to lactoylglutathione lyase